MAVRESGIDVTEIQGGQVPIEIELLAASQQLLIPPPFQSTDEIRDKYILLYQAALKGDWGIAKDIVESHPDIVRARITKKKETALHIAAAAKRSHFVRELVNQMTDEDLALQNQVGNTALCFAAASGKKELAMVMLERDPNLATIRGSRGMLPLYIAALLGHREMVSHLYEATDDKKLTPEDRIGLLVSTINTGLYDVALKMLKQHPELAFARDGNDETALHALAQKPLKPSTFSNGSRRGILRTSVVIFSGINIVQSSSSAHAQALELVKCLWEKIILSDDSKISELIGVPWRLLFVAAEIGNVEFLTVLIRSYPDLIWKVDEENRSIFHIAVMHRRENIFKLIYEIGAIKDLIALYKDKKRNNMLHLAGMLAPPNRLNIVSGAALQMQRELLWFETVKKVVSAQYAEAKNSKGETPRALFTKKHKGLLIQGEKWMKETATSCMLVATLIATVVFAAAFTVPGGNKQDIGTPVFLGKISFKVFAVSDAISLLSSSTAILLFLSILTSRYTEDDFLWSLPSRLIIGLATLFISIAAMMVAFTATIFIVFDQGMLGVGIFIAVIACVPVTLFALLHFQLFVDVIQSTYSSEFLSQCSKHRLY